MDTHNGRLVGRRNISESRVSEESDTLDSDSSTNASSETIHTESSYSSETSTAHSSDEDFIDDSSLLDGIVEDAQASPRLYRGRPGLTRSRAPEFALSHAARARVQRRRAR